jgi:hypothetical protein
MLAFSVQLRPTKTILDRLAGRGVTLFQISRLWVRFLPGVLWNPAGKPRVPTFGAFAQPRFRNRFAECCRPLGPFQTVSDRFDGRP